MRIGIRVEQVEVLSLVHGLFDPVSSRQQKRHSSHETREDNVPDRPEEPFLDRTKVEQYLIQTVGQERDEETSNGVKNIMVRRRLNVVSLCHDHGIPSLMLEEGADHDDQQNQDRVEWS